MLVSGLHTVPPESELLKVEPGNLYVNCSLGESNTPLNSRITDWELNQTGRERFDSLRFKRRGTDSWTGWIPDTREGE